MFDMGVRPAESTIDVDEHSVKTLVNRIRGGEAPRPSEGRSHKPHISDFTIVNEIGKKVGVSMQAARPTFPLMVGENTVEITSDKARASDSFNLFFKNRPKVLPSIIRSRSIYSEEMEVDAVAEDIRMNKILVGGDNIKTKILRMPENPKPTGTSCGFDSMTPRESQLATNVIGPTTGNLSLAKDVDVNFMMPGHITNGSTETVLGGSVRVPNKNIHR